MIISCQILLILLKADRGVSNCLSRVIRNAMDAFRRLLCHQTKHMEGNISYILACLAFEDAHELLVVVALLQVLCSSE